MREKLFPMLFELVCSMAVAGLFLLALPSILEYLLPDKAQDEGAARAAAIGSGASGESGKKEDTTREEPKKKK